jgi:hypothetical protein
MFTFVPGAFKIFTKHMRSTGRWLLESVLQLREIQKLDTISPVNLGFDCGLGEKISPSQVTVGGVK